VLADENKFPSNALSSLTYRQAVSILEK